MSLYEQNLAALQHKNSPLMEIVHAITELTSYEVYMDPENELSLNMVNTKSYKPLYPSNAIDAVLEQVRVFQSYQSYPYLYFFGVGNGMLLKQLLSNSNHKRIVVIEPDLEILYVVLNLVDFSTDISSGRLVFVDANSVDFPSIIWLLNTLETQRYARVYDLHVMSSYYDQYFEKLHYINKVFTETFYHMAMIAGNDAKDALIGLKHHITNLPKVVESFSLHSLFFRNDFPDVAVLVSTGPSLGKQLPLLKEIAPYVTIVAVDASLPVLAQHGIQPDIVTSIERVPATSRFFEKTPEDVLEKTVCVASSVQHAKVLSSIEKAQVVISLRPLAYMMLTGPREWGYIGIGMSSANMAYELIYHSHFKTCLLIGQDLAYGEDGTSHADGHIFGAQEVKYKESDSWVEAYGGGKKVRTTIVWNMFRGFFEKNIAEAKTTMETVNATEGGARIYGTLELPFERAIQTYVKHTIKKPLVLKKPSIDQTKQLSDETNAIISLIESYVSERQKEIETLFLEVANICEMIEKAEKVDDEAMLASLEKIDLIRGYAKDEIYQKVIWHIAQSMLFVQELSLASIEVRYACSEEDVYQKRADLLLAYKAWLFCLAGCVDAILKTITYAKGRSYIHHVETIGVYLEDMLIDTITCKTMSAEKGRVFDVDMRGILYDVADEYSRENISFKDVKTEALLPSNFVQVIDPLDEHYKKYGFTHSIRVFERANGMEDKYSKGSIGFLAIPENLEDREFMNYIRTLGDIFPEYTIKAIYFYAEHQRWCEKVLLGVQNVVFVNPKDIQELIEHFEIYIVNAKHKKLFNSLTKFLIHKTKNIFVMHFVSQYHQITLQEQEKKLDRKVWASRCEGLGLKQHNESFFQTVFDPILETLNLPLTQPTYNLYTFIYFDIVNYTLKYPEFKGYILSLPLDLPIAKG
jgi:hypothetical protein